MTAFQVHFERTERRPVSRTHRFTLARSSADAPTERTLSIGRGPCGRDGVPNPREDERPRPGSQRSPARGRDTMTRTAGGANRRRADRSGDERHRAIAADAPRPIERPVTIAFALRPASGSVSGRWLIPDAASDRAIDLPDDRWIVLVQAVRTASTGDGVERAGLLANPLDDVVGDARRRGHGRETPRTERADRRGLFRKNFDTDLRPWFHGATRVSRIGCDGLLNARAAHSIAETGIRRPGRASRGAPEATAGGRARPRR